MSLMRTWTGAKESGERRELDEQHERSAHAVAGVVVILNAALAWLVTTVAVVEATRWPVLAVMPFTLVFGVLVAAITRGIASGPISGLRAIVGRGLVAIAVGVVVGDTSEILEGFGIVLGDAITLGIHAAELPLRHRLALLGGILQRRQRAVLAVLHMRAAAQTVTRSSRPRSLSPHPHTTRPNSARACFPPNKCPA